MRKSTICVLIANFGILMLIIAVAGILFNFQHNIIFHFLLWGLLYGGQAIADLAILFSFRVSKSTNTSSQKSSKKVGSK